MKDNIMISLTTIPSRINNIKPVIDSLCNQLIEPTFIYINIPKKYNRFGECPEIPLFLKENSKVKINYLDIDYGPGTKFIGSLINKEIMDDDIIIITDDDTIKEKYWLCGLLLYYKYNGIIAYEEKNLGKMIVWGYIGYAFKKKIFDLNDMLNFYNQVKDDCMLVDDHWLTAYIHYKKINIKTVSIDNSNLINSGIVKSNDSLVNIKGSNSRFNVSEKCRNTIKNKYNTEFPFWCCIGCCKRGIRKQYDTTHVIESFSNTESVYSKVILLIIINILMYCKLTCKKKYGIIFIISFFIIYNMMCKPVEKFNNDIVNTSTNSLDTNRLETTNLETNPLETNRLKKNHLETTNLEKHKLEKHNIETHNLETNNLETNRLEKHRLESKILNTSCLEKSHLESEVIPKTLIQTHYDKSKIPQKVYNNIKKFAPEYKHIVWDDNECEEFMNKYFNPNILLTFRQLKGAHKADLFRYCYLYKYGGVYLDIKTELIKPLKDVFPNNYTYSVLSIMKDTIFQGIIATLPGNPIFLKLIYFMVIIVERKMKFTYLIFTKDFFYKIRQYCDKQPQPGLNIGKNGFNYYLYIEKCSNNPNHCNDGLDRYGKCCHIYDKNNNIPIIKNRYADFPW